MALTAFDDYHAMLSDRVRMDAYDAAIRQVVRPGDVVLDLGAGTGILGLMALRAGAKRIIAIEQGDAIELARAIARHNGITDRIAFHQASSRAVELEHRADVLVSETLGSLAIDESTLLFTLDARERLLVPNARMVPQQLGLWLAPVEAHEVHHRRVGFWGDVHGFDFAPAAQVSASKLAIATLDTTGLLAHPQQVASIDLATFETPVVEAGARFVFGRAGTVHGLAGWFDATLAQGVTLETGPDAPATHWKQAFLPFREPLTVDAGELLDVGLRVAPKGEEDNTTVSYQWMYHQARIPAAQRTALPCPCGTGKLLEQCCLFG
jgi:hypothetical protein